MSMRAIVSADLHVSNRLICGRSRLEVSMRVLEDQVLLAQQHNVKHIFWLGDVLDKKHGTPRSVLRAVYRFLKKVKYKTDIKIHILRGNHETPDNSDPHDTLLELFSEVCHVVSRPGILELGDTRFYLLPWYPAGDYIRMARAYAKKARATRGTAGLRHVLLTHVGLREGRISPSNIQLPQRVSLSHLYPNIFDLIILGDYHAHQFLADNAFYVGAPVAHLFGDEGMVGPWLVDTTAMDVESLVLPHRPPDFRKWVVTDPADLVLHGYRADDYNRIFAPGIALQALRVMYPGADLRVLESTSTSVDFSASRLTADDARNPERLLERFLKLRGRDGAELARLKAVGLQLLKEANS